MEAHYIISLIILAPWFMVRRLGTITSIKGETRMKHAENLFAQAVNQLIEIGEKASKEREARERKAVDREAIRVKRKEKWHM